MDFDFDYLSLPPPPRLQPFVESLWYARGTVPYARERIAPTGSTVAVFVLGAPILQVPNDGDGEALLATRGFLVGPHDRPAINAPQGETFAVGVVSTPVGCRALFGVAPSSLRGRVVDLEAAWPAAEATRAALVELAEASDGHPGKGMLRCVRDALLAQLQPTPGLARCAQAVRILEADPARPVAEIAEQLGLSHGHLDREFRRLVGLSPRALARLLRVRRVLGGLDARGVVAWSALAQEHGWFDQAHFIRDFKRHTGVTPSQYVAAQRAAYGELAPGEGAGFVPEA